MRNGARLLHHAPLGVPVSEILTGTGYSRYNLRETRPRPEVGENR